MQMKPIVECRICFEESEKASKLIRPCLCSGTIAYVHQHCLQRWATTSGKTTNCDMCKAKYAHITRKKTLGDRFREKASKTGASALCIWVALLALTLAFFWWMAAVAYTTSVDDDTKFGEKRRLDAIVLLVVASAFTIWVLAMVVSWSCVMCKDVDGEETVEYVDRIVEEV